MFNDFKIGQLVGGGYRRRMATAPRSYTRVVAGAAAQAALSATWIAARELSPARRRLARFGTVATVAAVGWVTSSRTPEPDADPASPDPASPDPAGLEAAALDSAGPDSAGPEAAKTPPGGFDRRTAAALGLGVLTGTAGILGRRGLEKRWLARLTRDGHRHPTRALAVRMAAVEFALHLALQLADRQKERSDREKEGSERQKERSGR